MKQLTHKNKLNYYFSQLAFNLPKMFFRNPVIYKILKQRIVSIPKYNFCSKKKDNALPEDLNSSIIAPKVVAKNPPIEQLTRGTKYLLKNEKVSNITIYAEKSVEKIPQKCDPSKQALPQATAPTNVIKETSQPPKTPSSGGTTSGDSSPVPPISRIKRQEPGEVVFCLIPISWPKAFNTRTGITGFWTFAFTFSTYLFSKEKIVMEHEYYSALSVILLAALSVKFVGPSIALGLDKQIDEYQNKFDELRIEEKQSYKDAIANEEEQQLSSAEQLVLVEAKRENVHLQQEAEYRRRAMSVHKRVIEMFDYHITYENIQRKFAHEQMVRWVIDEVHKAITDEIDSKYIDKCLDDMQGLLSAHVNA